MLKLSEKSKYSSLHKLEEVFGKLEKNTGFKKNYIQITMGLSLGLIWLGVLDQFLSYALTTIYPIIWSFRIIKKNNVEQNKTWLTYWSIYSIFTLLDIFSYYITKIFPFYFLIKTLILLWCFLPGFKGSLIVYNLTLVEILKISKKLKFLDKNKNENLKNEVEEILEQTEEKENEITCPNFDTNKKNN